MVEVSIFLPYSVVANVKIGGQLFICCQALAAEEAISALYHVRRPQGWVALQRRVLSLPSFRRSFLPTRSKPQFPYLPKRRRRRYEHLTCSVRPMSLYSIAYP